MSEIRKYFKDISQDCEERNIVITGVDFKEDYASGMQKVNWYQTEEERDRKFKSKGQS